MKVISPASKIEFLDSKHVDNGRDSLPSNKPWQLKIAHFGFQTIGRLFPKFMARQAYNLFATPQWRAKHQRPDDLILAAKVIDFPFDGHIVKLYEWGNDDSEKIILLAHGWESRGTALRMYVKPLLEKGFKIVAFDALGHGDSGGKQNNLLTNARTISAIYNHYDHIYGAIGHSFGCSSLVYAQQYVDNNIRLERLVFIAVPNRTRKIMDGFLAYMHTPKIVQNAFFDYVQTLTKQHIDLSDTALAYTSPNNRDASTVKVGKLLLFHDQKDEVTNISAAERVVEHWDNARLIVTNGYGHFRIAKNPDVIRKIVAFIAD
jgi:pimeloyl-ACP methyl ester carboxylesterase